MPLLRDNLKKIGKIQPVLSLYLKLIISNRYICW
jgi:hypothetical protein